MSYFIKFIAFILLTTTIIYSPSNGQDIDLSYEKIKSFNPQQQNNIIGDLKGGNLGGKYIYIVDNKGNRIFVFSKKENFIQRIGREGRGPGEFINPISISSTENKLFILDQSLNRFNIFTVSNIKESFALHRTETFNLNMTDFCQSNNQFWIYALSENGILHKANDSLTTIENSIAPINIQDNGIKKSVRLEKARNGLIACNNNYVISGYVANNKIRVYTVQDGALYKEFDFENIKPITFDISSRNGQMVIQTNYYLANGFDKKGNYHDSLAGINFWDNYLIVQYYRHFEESPSDKQFVISILVNIEKDTYSIFNNIPLILDTNKNELLTQTNRKEPIFHISKLEVKHK